MLILENKMLETNRAIARIENVSYISWKQYNENQYEVFIAVGGQEEPIVQMLSEDDLSELKQYYADNCQLQGHIHTRPEMELERINKKITIENGIITSQYNWAVDLAKVQFITIKENYEDGTWFCKLHLENKEVRVYLQYYEQVKQIMEIWKEYR